MAKSGSFALSSNAGKSWVGRIDYTLIDHPEDNQTEVQIKMYAYKIDGYSSGSNDANFEPRVTVDGVDYYATFYHTETTSVNLRLNKTILVPHNADGTKTLTIRGEIYKRPGNPETGLDNTSIIGATTLTLTNYVTGYTLSYNANGGYGAPSSVNNVTSTTVSSVVPTRGGYNFIGWSTSSSATVAGYVAGDLISLTSDTTLYAVWQQFYTVTYDANGGSNAPSADKKIDGQTLILDSAFPTPPGDTSITYTVTFHANGGTCDQDMATVTNVVTYEFTNWNTNSNGYGTTYQPGGSYVYDNDVTLYAQYTQTTTYNSITLPTPSRENYEFLGWSMDEYGTSGIIGKYTPTEDVALYAIWKIRGQVYIYDNTGYFSPYQVLIYDGSDWNQYIPCIYTEFGWEVCSG